MTLARSLHRGVELRGQLLEEIYPVPIALLSLLLAEPDDHQLLLGGYVDVLPIVTARREVVLTIRRVYPPEVLVVQGGVSGRVRARRLLDPPPGDELITSLTPALLFCFGAS